MLFISFFFFFQAEDGIRDYKVTGVQTCALPISTPAGASLASEVRVPRADGGAVLGGCRRESDAGGGRAGSAGRALSTAVRGPDDGDAVLPGAQERAAGRERLLHPLLTR